jgi:hypothetical protein
MTGQDMPVDDTGNVRCDPCRPNDLEFCRWCGRDMMPAQTTDAIDREAARVARMFRD